VEGNVEEVNVKSSLEACLSNGWLLTPEMSEWAIV
jgi:hypothetical protein